MTRFVEEGRVEYVELLLGAFDEMVVDGQSRLVTLTGPSGSGKTTIVQEFYRRLAARQDPQTWPLDLVDEDAKVVDQRKVVSLPLKGEKREGLPWVWLGLECGPGRDAAIMKISECLEEWVPLPFTKGAFDQFDPKGLAKEAAIGALETAVAATGLAFFLSILERSWKVFSTRKTEAKLRALQSAERDYNIGEKAVGKAWAAMAAVAAGRESLPIVLIIEDAHDADENLVQLLALLLQEEFRTSVSEELEELGKQTGGALDLQLSVLVCALTWPESLAVQRSSEAAGTTVAGLLDDLQADGRVITQAHNIGALPDSAIEQIALDLAPRLKTEEVAELTEHCGGNPLLLSLRLEFAARKKWIVDGIVVEPDKWRSRAEAFPPSVEVAFHELWKLLEEDVQDALGVASVQGRDFDPELAAAVALGERFGSFGKDLSEVESALGRAKNPYAWVREAENLIGFLRFYEPVRFKLAESGLDDHEREELSLATIRYIAISRQEETWWKRSQSNREQLNECILTLTEGLKDPPAPADILAEAGRAARSLASTARTSQEKSEMTLSALDYFTQAETLPEYWQDAPPQPTQSAIALLRIPYAKASRPGYTSAEKQAVVSRQGHLETLIADGLLNEAQQAEERLLQAAADYSVLGHATEGRRQADKALNALADPTTWQNALSRAQACSLVHHAEQAVKSAQQAIEFSRAQAHSREHTQTLVQLNDCLEQARPLAASLLVSIGEEQLDLARASEDENAIRGALRSLSWVLKSSQLPGSMERAVELLEENLDLARESGNETFLSGALRTLTVMLKSSQLPGSMERAIELLEERLDLARASEDENAISDALQALSRGLQESKLPGSMERIFELREERLDLARKSGKENNISGALRSLAQSLQDSKLPGSMERAVELFEENLDLARESGNETFLSGALRTLAQSLERSGLPGSMERAVELLEERLHLARASGNERAISDALQTLAVMLKESKLPGSMERAIELLEEALDLARASGNENNISGALRSLSQSLERSGLPGSMERAIELLEERLHMARESGNENVIRLAISDLGLLLEGSGLLGAPERAVKLREESETLEDGESRP